MTVAIGVHRNSRIWPLAASHQRLFPGVENRLRTPRIWTLGLFASYDHLWSYVVMKRVGIAELKSRLSEFLRYVQGGESIAVLDRNRAVAQIVPILERSGLRIRKPGPDSPAPNKVMLPKLAPKKIDVVELLLEERQSHR